MRVIRLMPMAAVGLVLLPGLRAADPTPADDRVRAVVDMRVADWWPTPEEKRFDQIGWAADIRNALRLAADHNRPVFLFTLDGRIDRGRC